MSKSETIKVKNIYFEQIHIVGPEGKAILSKSFQTLVDKDVFPKEYKPRYWLSRCLDKATQELNHYLEAKRDLVKRHAKKYEKDGKETKDGKTIREWKKGDVIVNERGEVEWEDFELYQKELAELQEIEVDFGFNKVVCDWESGPDVNQKEMAIILPFLAEPMEPSKQTEVVPSDKKKKKNE